MGVALRPRPLKSHVEPVFWGVEGSMSVRGAVGRETRGGPAVFGLLRGGVSANCDFVLFALVSLRLPCLL
jgi:hypothetical protein